MRILQFKPMSGIDKLREFAVKIGNGSGCLFPLENCDYAYVLTAKHVIEEHHELIVVRQKIGYGQKGEDEKLEIIDTPYLHSNPNKDAAIIKVKAIEGLPPLLKINYPPQSCDGYYLIGHPTDAREDSDSYRQNKVEIHNEKPFGYIEAQLDTQTEHRELIGQSGGGIIRLHKQTFLLIGVQKGLPVPNKKEMLNRIVFMPLTFFDEIISENVEKLEVLPLFNEEISITESKESSGTQAKTKVNIKGGFYQPNWQIQGNVFQTAGDVILSNKNDDSKDD
jgi:hypothetical protein